MHRKYKRTLIGGVSAVGLMVGISLLGSSPAFATSSIEINPGSPVGDTSLNFIGYNSRAEAEYYIPVKIDYTDIKDLTISVYARNANDTVEDVSSCSNAPGLGGCSDFEVVSLLGGNNNEYSLNSIISSKPVTDMNNEWGYRYKLANTNGVDVGNVDNSGDKPSGLYKPMYTINTTNKVIAEAKLVNNELPVDNTGSGTKYLNLGFGAGVTKSKEAVTYTGYAEIMVVANPNIITLFDIAESNEPTMQRITTEICRNTPTPSNAATSAAHTMTELENSKDATSGKPMKVPEVTLRDARDGKTYLIRKLADENCWMAQDLALDFLGNSLVGATGQKQDYAYAATSDNNSPVNNFIGDEVVGDFTLTSDDTDIPAKADGAVAVWNKSSLSGKTLYATIISSREEGHTGSDFAAYRWANSGLDGLRSYSYSGSVAKCTGSFAINNSAVCPQDIGYARSENLWKGQLVGENVVVYGDNPVAPYGQFGNLYNWTAATLGTGPVDEHGDGIAGEATGSICPKGWELPAMNGAKGFKNLLSDRYGIEDQYNQGTTEATTKIFNMPLNFMYTGYYKNDSGYITGRTTNSQHWSREASSQYWTLALGVNYRGGTILTEQAYTHGMGFPVRCVAK